MIEAINDSMLSDSNGSDSDPPDGHDYNGY